MIQAQPHGSKNSIVLYQEMWLRRSCEGGIVSAICHLQSPRNGSTGQVPPRFSDWCNDEASVLEVILGRQVGQREDTACDEDGVDVSVGVDDDEVVGVGVHGQDVNLGISLGVGIVVGSHPSLPSTLREPV